MASELRVDRIVPTNGGGFIIQVVQETKTDTASSSAGTVYTDMGLSATITPKSSTSKILVMVNANISSGAGFDMKARLMRGSTILHIGDAAGSRPRATAAVTANYSTTANYSHAPVAITYLDSPGTTSATTYKIQYASYSTYVCYINRSGSDINGASYDSRTASSITLMEISV